MPVCTYEMYFPPRVRKKKRNLYLINSKKKTFPVDAIVDIYGIVLLNNLLMENVLKLT